MSQKTTDVTTSAASSWVALVSAVAEAAVATMVEAASNDP